MNVSKNGINYIQYGKGQDVILLHGWGQNIAMMQPLGDNLMNCRVTIIDFPGFGESKKLETCYTIEDYSEELKKIIEELKIKNPILIGHSFGGRVAIHYSAYNKVSKVILLGSPCIRKVRKNLKEKILKTIKKMPLMDKIGEKAKKYIGSADYRNATPVMRETLVKVINRDLSEEAKKINCPVLMIWGSLDIDAPLEDAQEMEKIIKDCGLVVLDGYTHYAYLEALPNVSNIINNFLESEVK